MFIHYQKYGEELTTVETNRVTLLENGQQKFHVSGRVLVLGTMSIVNGIPLSDIQWFWIEDN